MMAGNDTLGSLEDGEALSGSFEDPRLRTRNGSAQAQVASSDTELQSGEELAFAPN